MFLKFAFSLCLLSVSCLYGQVNNPYHLNGSATQENCNCYTLTPAVNTQAGSVWNINKIDLSQPFDFTFNVYLGCEDATGADGIAFVLQPHSTSIGSSGEGLGYKGVSPSIGVIIDTWQNSNDNDPSYDHISIHQNGDINHSSPNNLAGPVTAIANNNNIEDCNWHLLRISWDPATKNLSTQVDGADRVQAVVDLVNTVFSGNPMVYWGFSAATGGSKNHQRFCTSLNPGFSLPQNVKTCYNQPIQFSDSSTSFGSIQKWYWDFGDGTIDSVPTPPAHIYSTPGIYEVKLKVLGSNGCLSENFSKKIIIGSKPIANILSKPDPLCDSSNLTLLDNSKVEFGTINHWEWNVNGTDYTSQNIDNIIAAYPSTIQASLQVISKEGCVSDQVSKSIQVLPRPVVELNYSALEACIGDAVSFFAAEKNPLAPIKQFQWNLGIESSVSSNPNKLIKYPVAGKYNIQLQGISENGCISTARQAIINIYGTNANAGRDTIVADNQPFQLSGSGGTLYEWTPSFALNNPQIANPVATLLKDETFILRAYTSFGCSSYDTLKVKVFKGPEIYVPNGFTPNGDGKNDFFRIIPVGMKEIHYFRIYNRYGQLIFSSKSPNPGWDGSGHSSGTYVWMVSGIDYNGNPHVKKGTVTLVR